MMTSNILSRFRPNNESTSVSIYETIRQHDEDSDGSDLEERAGLALDRRNLEEDFQDFDPNDVPSESTHAESNTRSTQRLQMSSASTVTRATRKLSRPRKKKHGRDLADVEEGEDDVPASLLIEGIENVLPHEIENLPPRPHQINPQDTIEEQARDQWGRTQAAQTSHPNARTAGRRGGWFFSTLASADPRQKAMYNWINVRNLDNFLADVYDYYLNHGFWSILLSRFFNLITVTFIFAFSLFLTQCVNYRDIKRSTRMPEILVPHCTKRMGLFPNILLWIFTFFWIWKVYTYVIDIGRLIYLHDFYHYLLEVPEVEIQSISWQEIVSRLMALRDSNPNIASSLPTRSRRFTRTQNKQRMDAHDIANRLMRKDNYMVAMINKEILNMTLPIPGLHNKQLFTRTLEWSLNWCIMYFVFDRRGQIREMFLKDTNRRVLSEHLRFRFVFAGTVTLLFAPFVLVYSLFQNFFRYWNEYQKDPGQIGLRRYNVLAEWKFREFNELWHLFQRRLNMSYPFAKRYINQFPKDKTVQAARFVTFVSGALVSVLGMATILDQENFLSFEITPGRSTIFYLGVFGTIWAVSRGLLPDDNEVYDSSFSMEEVIDFTHYRPSHWEGRLHTVEVKTEFAMLYQMQIVILIEELLSIVFTPFVLWFSLPKCSDRIIDFFREFTVHVDGVGYVCSFAEFNFRKPGNTIPSSSNTRAQTQGGGLRDEYFSTKDQKLEQSYWGFMNDYARNPKTDVRYNYREASKNRRRFNMPPPFPGLPSPTINPNTQDMSNAAAVTGRQSLTFSPRRGTGFQPTTPRFADQSSESPLQSLLLDPHHLPPNSSQFIASSPQALRPRNMSSSSVLKQKRPNQHRMPARSSNSLLREDTIKTTISENLDVPPDDLTGGSRHEKDTATPSQMAPPQTSAEIDSSSVSGSWRRPEEDDSDDTEEQEGEDDVVAALTGKNAGVLGLMRQFQRAQRLSTRTGMTGV